MRSSISPYRKNNVLNIQKMGLLINSLLILAVLMVCSGARLVPCMKGGPNILESSPIENDSVYNVSRLKGKLHLDGKWNKQPWKSVKPIRLSHYMGKLPDFRPRVRAKMLYDETYLYVIFQVKDRYVKSTVQEFNGPVSRDACVEFFFSPDQKVPNGYFNIEINAGGTPLAGYHIYQQQAGGPISSEDLKRLEIAHSLPGLIEKEITKPTTWTVEYKIPFSVLQKYAALKLPRPGDVWRANFYKIASEGSNPHYLTWSFVDHYKPNFHLPQFFGTIRFTE